MFVNEIKAHRYRALKTLALCIGYGCVGMCLSLRGPSLLDLGIATNSTLDEVAYIIPSTSAGFMAGAVLSGLLQEFVDTQILLGISFIGNAFSWGYVPWNRTLWSLCANICIAGFCGGLMNATGNVWLLHLWGKSTPPFMQALHFFFGLGAMISPLIVAPFLLPVSPQTSFQLLNTTQVVSIDEVRITRTGSIYTADDLRIQIPFAITAFCTLMASIIFWIVYAFKRDNKPHPTRKVDNDESSDESMSFLKKALIVCTMSVFMFLYFGAELSVGTLLATYAVKCDLKLDKVTGSYMTSLFWTTFTFFRCLTVFVVEYVGSTNLIIFDLFLIMLANAFLFPYGDKYEWALWTSSALIGLGMSSMFAAMYGFLDECIQVTNRVTSFLMVWSSLGVAVLPYLVGTYIDSHPEAYPLLCLISGTLSCFLFGALLLMKKCFADNLKENTKL